MITAEQLSLCPFCGSEHTVILSNDETFYHCNECGMDFTEDDFKHELLRQRISSICSAFEATEKYPLTCSIHIEGINEEAQGLSEAEKPEVTSVFQDSDGVVWITLADCVSYVDGKLVPDDSAIELDELVTVSLEQILEELEEQYHIETHGRMDKDGNLIDK